MTRITICPHLLVDYPQLTPDQIERRYIQPLILCLQEAEKENLQLCMSKEILDYFTNSFPWNLMNDQSWKGYLLTWHQLITQKIANRCFLISAPTRQGLQDSCSEVSEGINHLFSAFLLAFETKNMPRNLTEEGIISVPVCGVRTNYAHFHLVDSANNIKQTKYPWLRLYNRPLPPTGDYPFIPPNDWRTSENLARGPQHGYMDNHGNEWKWDMLHENHWDVQDGTPYTNVTPDGRIL